MFLFPLTVSVVGEVYCFFREQGEEWKNPSLLTVFVVFSVGQYCVGLVHTSIFL